MNLVVLSGNLVNDPEYTSGGETPRAKFRFAAENQRGGDPTFVNIVCFGKRADFANTYLKKGRKIIINGRVNTGSFDGEDGNKVYFNDIIADNIEFASSKPADE